MDALTAEPIPAHFLSLTTTSLPWRQTSSYRIYIPVYLENFAVDQFSRVGREIKNMYPPGPYFGGSKYNSFLAPPITPPTSAREKFVLPARLTYIPPLCASIMIGRAISGLLRAPCASWRFAKLKPRSLSGFRSQSIILTYTVASALCRWVSAQRSLVPRPPNERETGNESTCKRHFDM